MLICKRLEQTRQRVALTLRVGINENNDPVVRSGEAALESARFANIFLLEQTNTGVVLRNTLNFRSSSVSRAIVDDDHFYFALVICGQEHAQSFRNQFLFIVSGNDHTDRLREISFRSA